MKQYLVILAFAFLLFYNFTLRAQCNTATIYSTVGANAVCFDTVSNVLKCYSNNYPDHSTSYNSPFTISESDEEYSMCLYPDTAQFFTPLYEPTQTTMGCTWTYAFGISTNGVKYDPNSAEYFVDSSGADNINWHVEAIYMFGMSIGNNGGHLNPFGSYHYHDIPVDYFTIDRGIDGTEHSPIVGYAADGLPIYYKYAYSDPLDSSSAIVSFGSGYSLKSGQRPGDGFTAPDGPYTGLYYEDYEYATGDLDSCNGRYGVTPEFPNGTYYYLLTDNYPYIPRCFKGSVLDHTFRVGPAPACPSSTASTDCSTTPAAGLVFGCTDPFSCNYNPAATADDGSCQYDATLTDSISACGSYTWQSNLYTMSGIYYDSLSSTTGCDSILELVLLINQDAINDTTAVASCGEYEWQGNTLTVSGVYLDTLSSSIGCDSIIALNLTVIADVFGDTSLVAACNSYSWQGNAYMVSGTYLDTLTSSLGCDSIIGLDLSIFNDTKADTVNISSCYDYTWQNTNYTSSGIYQDTLSTINGCDSIVTLNLTVNNSVNGPTRIFSVCSSLMWRGNLYSSTGIYYDTVMTSLGCDSIITLDLTITGTKYGATLLTSACDQYVWRGNTYTASGIYYDTIPNGPNCDSILTLDLSINSSVLGVTTTITSCDQYVWRGTTYNNTGLYYDTLTNKVGCDSILMLDLSINPSVNAPVKTVSACGDYMWRGISYSSSGTYYDTLSSSFGCDSLLTLDLTVQQLDTSVTVNGFTLSAVQNNADYQWLDCDMQSVMISNATQQNFTPTSDGNYAVRIDLNGCIDTSTCYEIRGIGLKESKSQLVYLYPNPTDDILIIEFRQVSTYDLRVYDTHGKLLKQKHFKGKDIQVDVSSLSNGMYLLYIQGDKVYDQKTFRVK